MSRQSSVALIGLPRTGKSTYLGCLWQLIQDDRDTTVWEVEVSGDRTYVQSLGEQVALAEELKRTDVDSDDGLEIVVGFEGVGTVALEVPDLSGETLQVLIEDRVWHHRLSMSLTAADAVLLFVHPQRLDLPIRTGFLAEVLGVPLAEPGTGPEGVTQGAMVPSAPVDGAGDPNLDTSAATPTFSARMSSTAAKLIDALENLMELRRGTTPLALGIVVSAWDLVDGAPSPDEWLAAQLPALASYLEVNDEFFSATVFGVSAQGGRLPDDRDLLVSKGNVSKRAFAVDANGGSVPLSRPIQWALDR